MKCTKCGSDAVMKDGDWLTCLNCGNVMFDTRRPEETAAEISPTKLLEQMEAAAAQEEAPSLRRTRPEKKRKSRRKAKAAADKAEEKNPVKDIVDFMSPIVIAVILALLAENTCVCQCGSALRLHAQHHRDRRPDRGQPTGLYHQRPPAVRCGDLQIPGR